MSRTNRGSKGPGYDYMGQRAKSGDCGYGPDVKRETHRIERARAKASLGREIIEALTEACEKMERGECVDSRP